MTLGHESPRRPFEPDPGHAGEGTEKLYSSTAWRYPDGNRQRERSDEQADLQRRSPASYGYDRASPGFAQGLCAAGHGARPAGAGARDRADRRLRRAAAAGL